MAGAGCAVVLVGLLLDEVLGLDGRWVIGALLVAALLGGLLSLGEARRLGPMPAAEQRDAILGWGFIVGIVIAIVCLLIPMPWGAIAAVATVVGTALALSRFAARSRHLVRESPAHADRIDVPALDREREER